MAKAREPNTPRPNTPRPNTPRPSTPRPSTPRPSTPRPSTPKPSASRPAAAGALLATLQRRFDAHSHRHPGLPWAKVAPRLDAGALATLAAMEASGGEPDVVLLAGPGAVTFVDCAAESPEGRRSLCFDREAWLARKEARPAGSALELAESMGAELLDEAEYRALQALEPFDTKTSSWVATPAPIRRLGGALFCDRRYDHVFVYHNGAQSYYAARGFRVKLRV